MQSDGLHSRSKGTLSHVISADYRMERGAVFWYDFNPHFDEKGRIPTGEFHATTLPVVLMDKDPLRRFAEKLEMHVIPLTNRVDNYDPAPDNGKVVVHTPRGRRGVITSQATTINSTRIGNFMLMLSPKEMAVVSTELSQNFEPPKSGKRFLDSPGGVFEIPWEGKGTRTFLIIGTRHLSSHNIPILVTPVDSRNSAEAMNDPAVKPRPLSQDRFRNSVHKGFISRGALERVQMAARSVYGL